MSSIKDRALMIMRSLSGKTHMFTLSVLTCTLFLCVGFFLEPNTDYFGTTTSIKMDMENVSSSALQIAVEVKTLCKENSVTPNEIVAVNLVKSEDTLDELDDSVNVSYAEYEELCRLVQAEANSEDITGRTMVANVVLNRVASSTYGNDILTVINDPGQFEPVVRGAINYVLPDHDTKVAVMKALTGDDLTNGSLYFQRSMATEWGNKEFLFRYGSHSFYK